MEILRTPAERFTRLTDFAHPPRYADAGDGLRMAYVEAGPADGPVVVLLHGEPTWGYLYRSVLPALAAAGLRAIAPDLIGFGRSDKPARVEDHSYARQVEWTRAALFDALDLTGVTLVCQDWGGLIGLRLVAGQPDRFAAVVASNTGLPTGEGTMSALWWQFRDFIATADEIDVGAIVSAGCERELGDHELAAYNAPFPDPSYLAGVRALPALVPTHPDDPGAVANRAAWSALAAFPRPFLCAFTDGDPITAGGDGPMRELIPGARGRDHVTISGGGHFVQEDRPGELADVVVGLFGAAARNG